MKGKRKFMKINLSLKNLECNSDWKYVIHFIFYVFLSISPKISEKTPKNENPRKSEIMPPISDTKPGAS